MEVEIQGLKSWKTGRAVNKLPGMNEIIAAAKSGRGKYQSYSAMKEYYQMILYSMFSKLPGFNKVKIKIQWFEPNRRRDPDNIAAGAKFIMDALVKASVITDDSQRYVKGIENIFDVDKDNPRIVVEIEEVEG